jgi:putative ABC transport system permease protein
MMADRRATNRAMFWRIIRRLFGANPGRLFVMLLALGAGAADTAALLNLQLDAKRRLTTEFRAFGANVVISPRNTSGDASHPDTLSQDTEKEILQMGFRAHVGPFLYLSGGVSSDSSTRIPAIVVGMLPFSFDVLEPSWKIEPRLADVRPRDCMLGAVLSSHLRLAGQRVLRVFVGNNEFSCIASRTLSSGGEEDNQVFIDLTAAQSLALLPNRISLIQMSIPGTSQQIQNSITALQKRFADTEVRPNRQFTEGEAKIYNRISGLLTATVAIVLLLTGLCVMAAMTNVAMERRMDVGLMKAIGGSVRRVLRLFLAEAALLGLAGGVIGAAAGIFLSIGLGKAVFGVAARPRLIVYPVAVALTVIVAILSAFPLRRLASIRPASVFRGEA